MCLGLVFYSDLFPFLLTTKLILCTPGHKVVTPWNPLLTEVGRQPRTLPAWTPSYFKHSKSYPKTKKENRLAAGLSHLPSGPAPE